jgi:hypothetical protein
MHLINYTDTNFTNDDLIDLIKRINTESNMCGDIHCSMVINFLNKLLPKEEQTKKKPRNMRNQRADILIEQIKNQKERNMRNALEFQRRAEKVKLMRAKQARLIQAE